MNKNPQEAFMDVVDKAAATIPPEKFAKKARPSPPDARTRASRFRRAPACAEQHGGAGAARRRSFVSTGTNSRGSSALTSSRSPSSTTS